MKWVMWGIGVMVLGLVWVWQQWPDEKLRIVFCDVGQGDASLVIKGEFQMLVDTGPSKDKLNACLDSYMPFWDREIEVVVNSHDQRDHWGAIEEVEKRYQIGRVVTASTSAVGDVVRYGSLSFEILSGEERGGVLGANTSKDENESSLVGLLSDEGVSVLYSGDIGEETELALEGSGVLRKLTVLKVAHHGSKYSSTKSFLEVVRPDWAIVSVGAKNSYGHPNGDVLMRLDGVGSKILRTDSEGSIELVCEAGGCSHNLN